jgi:electron transport complex protein RnfB
MAGCVLLLLLTCALAVLLCRYGGVPGVPGVPGVEGDEAIDRIREVLPQTQCRQCGFAGCAPYAVALAEGRAAIDRCLPGGEAVAVALATLLGRERPRGPTATEPRRVHIDEAGCIGCARCLVVCPVDAILGAPRQLHVVLNSWCTGCELCIPSCPVDCIRSFPAVADRRTWRWPVPEHR